MLAAPLPVQPVAAMPAAQTAFESASTGAIASSDTAVTPVATVAASVAAHSSASSASAQASAVPAKDTTAAQQFAAKAAPQPGATSTASGQSTHATQVPAVAGRPGTVAHSATAAMPTQSPANAGSIGGAVLALVMVVGLILALGWIAKRLPGFRGASGNGALRVVSQLTLGPRERVVVVAVGDTQLLIGVGAGGLRTLHTLQEPLPVAAPAATPAFAQLLAQHFGKKA
jgi:flagellar protein FliO/FliZ